MTCCIVDVTLRKILHQNAHCIREDVTSWCRASWCRTSCPLLLNSIMWPNQNLKNTCVSERHGLEEVVSWCDHRSWCLAIRTESRTPVSHEIAPSGHGQPGLTTSQSDHCEPSPHSTASSAQQKPTGRWCDVETLDASLSVRYERVWWDCQHQRHEDAKGCRPRRTAGRAPGMFCDLSAGESDEVPNPTQSPIIGSRRQSGSQLPLSTSPASSESSAVSACPLACLSVLTSPVELKANSSPVRRKEDCSPTAVPSQSSRGGSLQERAKVCPTAGPCSDHFETGEGGGAHSFCPAASGNRVLHTLSRLWERHPVPLDDVAQKQRTSPTRTRVEGRHTGMDHGVSRRRRTRLADAVKFVFCGSVPSVRSNKLAVRPSFQFCRDY